MTRQEEGMDADAPTKKGILPVVKIHGPVGHYGFDWGFMLLPFKQKSSDGGDFFRGKHRHNDDEDQEDSLEGESFSDAACAGASSDSSADFSSGNGFSEGESD